MEGDCVCGGGGVLKSQPHTHSVSDKHGNFSMQFQAWEWGWGTTFMQLDRVSYIL
jgi:hypothetical protein